MTTTAPPAKHSRPQRELAQAKFLKLRGEGHTVEGAMRLVGYAYETEEKWRQRYPEFRVAASLVTQRLKGTLRAKHLHEAAARLRAEADRLETEAAALDEER
jgi:hypothetical protein